MEQQLKTNIRQTQNKIWHGVSKDVGYLRRILNELYIMRFKVSVWFYFLPGFLILIWKTFLKICLERNSRSDDEMRIFNYFTNWDIRYFMVCELDNIQIRYINQYAALFGNSQKVYFLKFLFSVTKQKFPNFHLFSLEFDIFFKNKYKGFLYAKKYKFTFDFAFSSSQKKIVK